MITGLTECCAKVSTCQFRIISAQTTMDAPIDENTKRTVQQIPLLTTRAGPRDGESWTTRLKEEYLALIQVRLAACLSLCVLLSVVACVGLAEADDGWGTNTRARSMSR